MSKITEQMVQDLSMAYTTAKHLFNLRNNQSQDARWNQASVNGGNRNYRPNSPKGGRGDRLEGRGGASPNREVELNDRNFIAKTVTIKAPCPASYAKGPIENLYAHRNSYQPRGMTMMSELQLIRDLSHDEPTLAAVVVVEEGSLSELTQQKPYSHYRNIVTQDQKVRVSIYLRLGR